MGLRTVRAVVWEAGDAWLDDRAPRIAAALAFFTAFSMAPLLVIALVIAGSVYGAEGSRRRRRSLRAFARGSRRS